MTNYPRYSKTIMKPEFFSFFLFRSYGFFLGGWGGVQHIYNVKLYEY